MQDSLLKINQVAEILQVSRSKVYLFMKNKENPLPVIYLSDRTPRIKQKDLDAWIKKQEGK